METLWGDLRYAVRMLLRKPGLTAAAVITLALGIGANTAIFSVVNGVLLRSLPFEGADRLVMVRSMRQGEARPSGQASFPDYDDWRKQSQAFEELAAFYPDAMTLTGRGDPERIKCAAVTSGFFPLLGVRPLAGRHNLSEDDQAGAAPVVTLSYGLWQRLFGSDPGIIGQALTLNGNSTTVVGVLPPDFSFPAGLKESEMFVPFTPDNETANLRGARLLTVVGKLKPGMTQEQAQAEMNVIAQALEQQYPATNKGRGIDLVLLYEQITGGARKPLLLLMGAVVLVLLIACSNVANLFLSNMGARQKDIAMRMALGASRGRIIRLLLTESALLALVGGGLGLVLAFLGIRLLVALAPDNLPRLEDIGVDFWVMGFTALLSLLTSIIFGLAPALRASKPDLVDSLKQSSPGAAYGGNRRLLRNLLVVSEVALAFVLLVGAGLLIRSFLQLQKVDLGFDPNNVLTMQISLPVPDFADNPKVPAFFSEVVERAGALPSVESAAGITQLPLSGGDRRTTFTIENRPAPAKGEEPRAVYRSITPNYFRTMRIPLLRGREFTERDRRDSPGVAIINEAMARLYWPDEDPVGKRISPAVKLSRTEPAVREIVGVVGDVRYTSVDSEPLPELYIPHTQQSWYFMALAVRTSSDPMAMAGPVRREVMAVDENQPVYHIQSMKDLVSKSIAQPRFYSTTLGVFATLALILAAVGVYAVMSYSVTQRTHEIGVRMAVGAERRDVINLVMREGMVLALTGMVIGMAGALALTRVVASLLFGVGPNDLITFALIGLLLTQTALLACYIPARRATKIDPMLALRYE